MSSTDASAAADAPQLRIIVGPTGAGKSGLAMALAAAHGARIISADSRQIYRGFDIGTAKPTAADRARVPHDGLDVAEPTERWSAARWSREAAGWIDAAAARTQPVVIVGGTGLWLQALVRPLADEPAMDPARRAAVAAELAALATPELRARVEKLDPSRAHLGRVQLLRAAEVALVSGTPISEWHARGSSTPERAARWLVVDPETALHERLDARREEMVRAGWFEEVERLAAIVPETAPAWNACGYREIRDVVRGTRARTAALELVRIRTRQYAKRQRTWFRNQLEAVGPVTRIDPTAGDALERAERWFTHGAVQ
jgi:tRNA dimethylallyltransferase